MNFISALTWMWKAFRDHSVTFAVLLALALLGISVIGGLREGLRGMDVPWWMALMLPAVLVGVLARKEREWIPDRVKRKCWSRGIVGVAILLAMIMAIITRSRMPPGNGAGEGMGESSSVVPIRPRGPSGK